MRVTASNQLRTLPNVDKFRFIGEFFGGNEEPCRVVFDTWMKTHFVVRESDWKPCYCMLKAWRNLPEKTG
jgi:hypothetical protein